MPATRINHVSVVADDLDESAGFYEALFGMERLPTARFREPVLWLRLGEQQLHLFQIAGNTPTPNHHFALDVDDFEAVYAKARALGVLSIDAFGAPLRRHPAGWVQLYLRDPAGNLVEVNWPDASMLSPETQAAMTPLESMAPQVGDAAAATLYHSTS